MLKAKTVEKLTKLIGKRQMNIIKYQVVYVNV